MSDDIAEQFERLITVNERIADSLERMESTLDGVSSDVSSIKQDADTTDSHTFSAHLDLEYILAAVREIHLEMP